MPLLYPPSTHMHRSIHVAPPYIGILFLHFVICVSLYPALRLFCVCLPRGVSVSVRPEAGEANIPPFVDR